MIKIGNKPIIWHIIKHLSSQGVKQFIVCTGYKEMLSENIYQQLKKIGHKVCLHRIKYFNR